MKTKLTMWFLAALVAAGLLLAPKPICAGDCGLLPLKPLIPLGCKDLSPQCVCNAKGDKCAWQWQCVK